ncbi:MULTISPECIES: hypothetical protein [Planktothricoides]|uniref:Transposase n=1 Tax=Planktothricoides raciborskii GIHE-MW2 TaxID=2792601 RepID=A0AAU8J7R1_9CYAN|nr:hypothetical protein [Planktothricoides sp. SR001]KOR38384.1 hypothetical protein AM228_02165 [Planktothricoides sp. SR001]
MSQKPGFLLAIALRLRNRVSLDHLCDSTKTFIETRFLSWGQTGDRAYVELRNRVSLDHLCDSTKTFIETRFLSWGQTGDRA